MPRLDAADAGETADCLNAVRAELLDGTGMLVIRHVHLLNAAQVRALTDALSEAKAAGGRPRSHLREGRTIMPSAAGPAEKKLYRTCGWRSPSTALPRGPT